MAKPVIIVERKLEMPHCMAQVIQIDLFKFQRFFSHEISLDIYDSQ